MRGKCAFVCVCVNVSVCDAYQVPPLPRRAYYNELGAWGFREWTTCTAAELVTSLDSPASVWSERSKKHLDTQNKSEWWNGALFFSLSFVAVFAFGSPRWRVGAWVWEGETDVGFLMAETGSLVKRLGLGKKPAGITWLSTCQDPRDQPVPRRFHSQAEGRTPFDDTPPLWAAVSRSAWETREIQQRAGGAAH